MQYISSQKDAVLAHLKANGSITSKEAIDNYGATRLSSIIHILRHKEGYVIETHMMAGKTRFGHSCEYAKYVLKED